MWYHGTNQIIDKFAIGDDIQGISTSSCFTEGVIYFTESPSLADDYSHNAANKLYPGNHQETEDHLRSLGEKYDSLLRQRRFNEAEVLNMHHENLEASLQEDESGQHIYPVHLLTKKVKVFDDGGQHFYGDRATDYIEQGRALGVDVVVVANTVDKPSMHSSHEPSCIAIVLNPDVIVNAISPERSLAGEYSVFPLIINRIIEQARESALES